MTDRTKSPINRDVPDMSDHLNVQNKSGETIPAYGCVKLSAYDYAMKLYECEKPDGKDGLYFVNGPLDIPADGVFRASLWVRSRAALVADGLFGEEVGPVADEWTMSIETTVGGWRIFGTSIDSVCPVLYVNDGTTHHIEFTVLSSGTDEGGLFVVGQVDSYSGGCTKFPPGYDIESGTVKIYDTCVLQQCLDADKEIIGRQGYASWMYEWGTSPGAGGPRDPSVSSVQECDAKWKAITLCCPCCDGPSESGGGSESTSTSGSTSNSGSYSGSADCDRVLIDVTFDPDTCQLTKTFCNLLTREITVE